MLTMIELMIHESALPTNNHKVTTAATVTKATAYCNVMNDQDECS